MLGCVAPIPHPYHIHTAFTSHSYHIHTTFIPHSHHIHTTSIPHSYHPHLTEARCHAQVWQRLAGVSEESRGEYEVDLLTDRLTDRLTD